jgi:hypothetical protein
MDKNGQTDINFNMADVSQQAVFLLAHQKIHDEDEDANKTSIKMCV